MEKETKKLRVIKGLTLRELIDNLNESSISCEEIVTLDIDKCTAVIYY